MSANAMRAISRRTSQRSDRLSHVFDLLPIRKGHFRYESGHHSDKWIDLERLCLRPEPMTRLAYELADRLTPYSIDADAIAQHDLDAVSMSNVRRGRAFQQLRSI